MSRAKDSSTRLSGRARSDGLLKAIGPYQRIVVVMHDNPDPDAIAAGWALTVLIRKCLGRSARLVGGGDIVRAENRHLVNLLKPPIHLVTELDVEENTAAVLVDCSFVSGNHLLAKEGVRPVAVIDHHVSSRQTRPRVPFMDLRPSVAAAASIAASYLREQAIEPGTRLATALSYAIRTETRGSQVHHARLDRSALRWLADYANPEWIAEIESAPLPRAYFGDLSRALDSTVVHGDVAFCLLPRAHGPEIVGEVADLLIRAEALRSVLCAAIVNGDLAVSVRTLQDGQDGRPAEIVSGRELGGSGGHAQRAGGKVAAPRLAKWVTTSLERDLKQRWSAANELKRCKWLPLVERDPEA